MFKVNDRPKFTTEISVKVPDGEGHRTETFKATFAVLPEPELPDAHELGTQDGQRIFLQKVLVGLDDVVSDDDRPLEFTLEVRDAVIGRLDARSALIRGYFDKFTSLASGN